MTTTAWSLHEASDKEKEAAGNFEWRGDLIIQALDPGGLGSNPVPVTHQLYVLGLCFLAGQTTCEEIKDLLQYPLPSFSLELKCLHF